MIDKPRLEFIVPGPAVPYQRVSQFPIKSATGKVVGFRNLTPRESRNYLTRVADYAKQAAKRSPLWSSVVLAQKLPVRIHIHVVRMRWLGDIDNLQKNILDGLQLSEVIFFNDNRVTQLLASVHTDPKQMPRAEILIETANAELTEPLWMRCAREAGWVAPCSPDPQPFDGYALPAPETVP